MRPEGRGLAGRGFVAGEKGFLMVLRESFDAVVA
jgi:hypothetical protein